VFRRHETKIGHELPRIAEASDVTKLRHECGRRYQS
jgi:hypothetical protein